MLRSLSVPPALATAGKPNTVCCLVVGGSSTWEGSFEEGIPAIGDWGGAFLWRKALHPHLWHWKHLWSLPAEHLLLARLQFPKKSQFKLQHIPLTQHDLCSWEGRLSPQNCRKVLTRAVRWGISWETVDVDEESCWECVGNSLVMNGCSMHRAASIPSSSWTTLCAWRTRRRAICGCSLEVNFRNYVRLERIYWDFRPVRRVGDGCSCIWKQIHRQIPKDPVLWRSIQKPGGGISSQRIPEILCVNSWPNTAIAPLGFSQRILRCYNKTTALNVATYQYIAAQGVTSEQWQEVELIEKMDRIISNFCILTERR